MRNLPGKKLIKSSANIAECKGEVLIHCPYGDTQPPGYFSIRKVLFTAHPPNLFTAVRHIRDQARKPFLDLMKRDTSTSDVSTKGTTSLSTAECQADLRTL